MKNTIHTRLKTIKAHVYVGWNFRNDFKRTKGKADRSALSLTLTLTLTRNPNPNRSP